LTALSDWVYIVATVNGARARRRPQRPLKAGAAEVTFEMSHSMRSAKSRCLVSALTSVCGVLGALCATAATTPSLSSSGLAELAAVDTPRVSSAVPRDPQIEARIADLLRQLSLEQKVAQMVQADIRYVTPEDVRVYRLGAILNGGGAFPANNKHAAISDWVALADRFYDASMDSSRGAPAIPVIWGTDAVHGHNNVFGATLFPHNIGLGAAHDPALVERIGAVTAQEVAATGIDWTFAPTVAVVRDVRWGRSYEGYSEDPRIVRAYAASMVRGLQGVAGTSSFLDAHHIVATAKHFVGDGGTDRGIDRGDNRASERALLDVHAQGYLGAIQSGVQTVMASYNSWQGVKMHGQPHLLTDVLKMRWGFDGLVISDWDAIDEVQSCSKDKCAQAVNAGIDLFMVPELWRSFIENTVAQVRAGDIPETRIDDAVTRILRVKLRAGLFEKGRPSSRPLANQRALIGATEHRAVAREAVRKSLVLLKNAKSLLPLRPRMTVLVGGDGADNLGKQTGGWTLTWQGSGNSNEDFPGATSIFEGIRSTVAAAGGSATLSVDGSYQSRPDVAIVVFGENPYAEWHGDIRSLDYKGGTRRGQEIDTLRPAPEVSLRGAGAQTTPVAAQNTTLPTADGASNPDLALLLRLRHSDIPVVAVFLTGRPREVGPEFEASDAFVVAWLPGSEGGGIADVLFRRTNAQVNFDFTGKLPFSWPRDVAQPAVHRPDGNGAPLFPHGFGLSYCMKHCGRPSS
jgi:beta-glucosidase